ncbi:MAG TPA: OmpH family outer membrane protein [Gemmatimonadaceae bacterium]|jgi:outer membrane protein|nr:OmpH family outer membrane protein [Gemmatimonadaceae bacterium]
MSSILRALVGAATVLAVSHAAPLAAQGAPQRFAYVDTKTILDQAPGRAEAEALLQKEAVAWDAEVKKMQDANIALVTEFQKNSATMTAAQRDQRTKAITDKQAEWQKRNDEINAEADRRKAELLQPILDQVKIALEDVRKAAGLDAIFDVAQNATIVAVDKNLNISDRVIARLRLLGAPVITPKSDTPKTNAPAAKPSGLPVSAPSGVGRPTPIKPDSNPTKKPDAAPVE